MGNFFRAFDRGRVNSFPGSAYEIIFPVFMAAIVYFYRYNPRIAYPRILYFFLLLMISNIIFNNLLRNRVSLSLWVVDLTLLFNLWVITGVLYYSGGGQSYFWVLYLLPIFAAALLVNVKDVAGVVFLAALTVSVLSLPVHIIDVAAVMSLLVKLSVFILSAVVVYHTAEAKKRAELGLVTKRKEVETMTRELLNKDSELERTASAGATGQILGGVMHDLGNSISVILLSAQIAGEDEVTNKDDIERIIKAARFSKGVFSNALNMARGQEYDFVPGDLHEPLGKAVQLLDYMSRERGAAIKMSVPADLPLIKMSKVHLERMFVNILSNSLSVVPQNGSIAVNASAADGKIKVEISDNGPGFPAQLLSGGIKAFTTTRKETGGTGIGLYVSMQIAAKHGGELSIANAPSGGALVRITLPAYSSPA